MVQRPSNMILGWQIISVQPCPACSWLLLSSKTWKSSFKAALCTECSPRTVMWDPQETIPPIINHGAMKIIIPRIRVYPISNNMNLLAEEFDPSPFSLELISPTRNTCSVLDLFINCGARHEGYLLFDAQYIYWYWHRISHASRNPPTAPG